MIAALIGTAIDRNTAISSRNESSTTPPITQGSRLERWLAASTPAAVTPPT